MKQLLAIFFFLLITAIPDSSTFCFSTHSVEFMRTCDKTIADIGTPITFTASWTNLELETLRGFYFVEQLFSNLRIDTVSVAIDGQAIEGFIEESGLLGDSFDGLFPYRWVIEAPPDFSGNNPIPVNSTLEIVYIIRSDVEGTFDFEEFHWVGGYPSAEEGSKAAFGYSELSDAITIMFMPACEQDDEPDGDVDGTDLAKIVAFTPSVQNIIEFAEDFGRLNCPK